MLAAEVVCGELARRWRSRSGAGHRRRRARPRGGRARPGGAGAAAALRRHQPGHGLPARRALDFSAHATDVDPELAGRVLWFDALVGNVDRSWRNPNMLFWHGRLQLIDHGAALTFHHHWPGAAAAVARPYDAASTRWWSPTPTSPRPTPRSARWSPGRCWSGSSTWCPTPGCGGGEEPAPVTGSGTCRSCWPASRPPGVAAALVQAAADGSAGRSRRARAEPPGWLGRRPRRGSRSGEHLRVRGAAGGPAGRPRRAVQRRGAGLLPPAGLPGLAGAPGPRQVAALDPPPTRWRSPGRCRRLPTSAPPTRGWVRPAGRRWGRGSAG